jgi:hypothetical protein
MERLYNEYSAAKHPSTNIIDGILTEAFKRILREITENGVDIRDTEGYCHSVITTSFAEEILKRAILKRKEERLCQLKKLNT